MKLIAALAFLAALPFALGSSVSVEPSSEKPALESQPAESGQENSGQPFSEGETTKATLVFPKRKSGGPEQKGSPAAAPRRGARAMILFPEGEAVREVEASVIFPKAGIRQVKAILLYPKGKDGERREVEAVLVFPEAEAELRRDPILRAGRQVKVTTIGDKWVGQRGKAAEDSSDEPVQGLGFLS
jgi:hypothetical protein